MSLTEKVKVKRRKKLYNVSVMFAVLGLSLCCPYTWLWTDKFFKTKISQISPCYTPKLLSSLCDIVDMHTDKLLSANVNYIAAINYYSLFITEMRTQSSVKYSNLSFWHKRKLADVYIITSCHSLTASAMTVCSLRCTSHLADFTNLFFYSLMYHSSDFATNRIQMCA